MQLAMHVPSSLLRWRVQQRELFAISDDSELGLMQSMLTVSMNDGCPELAACVRRGPFAVADENEMVEYLLSRKRINRASAEKHSVYHVIAYQRRLHAIKQEFFKGGQNSPLGRLVDWWDRCIFCESPLP